MSHSAEPIYETSVYDISTKFRVQLCACNIHISVLAAMQVPCLCLCCILIIGAIIAAVVGIKMALP